MTKRELIEQVARKAHLTKKSAQEAVETFLQELERALVKGEKVVLTGFGTFRVIQMKQKQVRVPGTGEEKIIRPHRLPRFVPGKSLKRIVKR